MTPELLVVPFRRQHYAWLSPRAEGGRLPPMSDALLAQLEASNSWTGVTEGEPVVCAGTVQAWPGRHQAWAYVTRGTLRLMPQITTAVLSNLARLKGRIEFTVRADFPAGLRWARTLGFEVETPRLRAFGLDGEDHVGFVRVN